MSQQRIRELLDKLLANDCSSAEKQELFQLVEQVEDQPELKDLLEDAWNRHDKPTHTLSESSSAVILQSILNDGKVVPITAGKASRGWYRIAAAAAVLLIVGLGAWWSMNRATGKNPPTDIVFKSDVKAPANSKATITLAGGQQLLLDDVKAGQLTTQGHIQVEKLNDGSIVYKANDQAAAPGMILNTLNNPRGSQVISLVLTDGTKVWLNAGSSLTYPVAFAAQERKVTVNGEVYFEVKPQYLKDGHKTPFVVSMATAFGERGQVSVLGTHFNIKAYDEETIRVTLLEGSVKVGRPGAGNRQSATGNAEYVTAMLTPGQQAILSTTRPEIELIANADVDQAVAWKEGLFDYKRSSITEVLSDAARWYDIDIAYEGVKPDDTFTGGIQRSASLTELLTILQMSRVRFKLEGKKLTVLK